MSVSGASDSTSTWGTTGPDASQETGKDHQQMSGKGNFKPPISGLKDISPEEWQKYLQMLAQNICTNMKKHSDKFVKEIKKSRSG